MTWGLPWGFLWGGTGEFSNPSFEVPDGLPASIQSANSEPFSLVSGQSLLVQVDGGSDQSIVLSSGTLPEVVSTNTQPFALVDGQTLTVSIDGDPAQTAVFNTADFSDIGAATASEVAAVVLADVAGSFIDINDGEIRVRSATSGSSGSVEVTGGTANATLGFPTGSVVGVDNFVDIGAATAAEVAAVINVQVFGVIASDTTGSVGLVTDVTGDEATIMINGGSANTALAFPSTVVTGRTRQGYAADWSLSSTSSSFEIADFDAGFPSPVEDFEEEWGQLLQPAAYTAALLNPITGPNTIESFEVEWNNGPQALGSVEAAVFLSRIDQFLTVTMATFEDFERWPNGNDIVDPTFFVADMSGDPVEDFEADWGHGVTASFTAAAFNGDLFENFETNTQIQRVVEVNLAAVGETYVIEIDGEPAVVTPTGGSTFDLADDLATACNNLSRPITASAAGSFISLTHDDPGITFLVRVQPPPGFPGALTLSFPDPTIQWTGASFLCV